MVDDRRVAGDDLVGKLDRTTKGPVTGQQAAHIDSCLLGSVTL